MSADSSHESSAIVEFAGGYVDGWETRWTLGGRAVGNCRRPGERGERRALDWALVVSDRHHRHPTRPGYCSRRVGEEVREVCVFVVTAWDSDEMESHFHPFDCHYSKKPTQNSRVSGQC